MEPAMRRGKAKAGHESGSVELLRYRVDDNPDMLSAKMIEAYEAVPIASRSPKRQRSCHTKLPMGLLN